MQYWNLPWSLSPGCPNLATGACMILFGQSAFWIGRLAYRKVRPCNSKGGSTQTFGNVLMLRQTSARFHSQSFPNIAALAAGRLVQELRGSVFQSRRSRGENDFASLSRVPIMRPPSRSRKIKRKRSILRSIMTDLSRRAKHRRWKYAV